MPSHKSCIALTVVCLVALTLPASAAVFTVTTPAGDVSPGSLGAAIVQANANGVADVIVFAIDPGVWGPGPYTILAANQYTLTEPGTTIDGFSQPGSSPNTIPAPGALDTRLMISVSGRASAGLNTFGIDTANVVLRGLNIHSGPLNDVAICFLGGVCNNNRIEGCFIGTDPTGTLARPSGWNPIWNPPFGAAVYIGGRSRDNMVGELGGDPAARNLLSGESMAGLFRVGYGVLFVGWGGAPNQNFVVGNLIGTDPSAQAALGNNTGVAFLDGSINNHLFDNVIAGNLSDGVNLEANAAGANNANLVLRNFIGISPINDSTVPNGRDGVYLGRGSQANLIGSGDLLQANVISGNGRNGVSLEGANLADSSANVVDGNIIGLDTSGAGAVANALHGVWINNVRAGNRIGNPGNGNLIGANLNAGVQIDESSNNTVENNVIGWNAAQDTPRGNLRGVTVNCGIGCSNNLVAGNRVSNSAEWGIYQFGGQTGTITTNTVENNGSDGIHLLGVNASNLVSENGVSNNGGWGVLCLVNFSGDFSPAGAGNDQVSAPQITGNNLQANLSGGILSRDTEPTNGRDLHLNNTIGDNNGQPDVLQRWYGAVELLDPSLVPIASGLYTTVLRDASGATATANVGSGSLWGPAGFAADDARTWFDLPAYRVENNGTFVELNPYTLTTSGPTVGTASYTFDGQAGDPSLGGQPAGIATAGQYRYQIAELITELDTDGDGVADSVDCAPADPLFDGVIGPACDFDGDGYCDRAITGLVQSSACPAECILPLCDPSDCNDSDAAIHPAASEGPPASPSCSDSADNDCDGTVDGADPGCQCSSDAQCADSNLCNGTERCVAGVCVAGTDLDCSDANPCTDDGCDPSTGCVWTNNAAVCDDGDACTMSEACAAGACTGGVPTDADGDGYVAAACGGTDCDDSAPGVHPGAVENCSNGIDDDCDTAIDAADSDCAPVDVCGDGTIGASEQCDDTNLAAGDGCSAICTIEAGWACRTVSGASRCGSAAVAGAVVITEIMQNPACVNDSAGEWFELRNASGADLQLRGWRLFDDGSDNYILQDLFVPASGRAVLCRNLDPLLNGNVTCNARFSGTLGNDDDELVLGDPADVLVDRVAWDDGSTFPDPNGAAMSLTSGADATTNDNGANWCVAINPIPGGCGDLGTPGAANPDCSGACPDADDDGFQDAACGGADCDDSSSGVYPGAAETCDDGIDQDCNGADLICGCADADDDGHQAAICGGNDCDDDDALVNPDMAEQCDNGIDDDCDGLIDALDSDCAPIGCGNGSLGAGESCDDGGLVPGDGCGPDCQIETGWACLAGRSPSLCGSQATTGEVVITEILQNPDCASALPDSQGEWFEIRNASGRDLVLRGWQVSDYDGDSSVIVDLALLTGGYGVLCRNTDPVTNGNVICAAAFTGSLGNADDELVLRDPAGTLVDQVAWDGGPAFPDPAGASMSLAFGADALANDFGANWCTASRPIPGGCGDLGTPGVANPPCGNCLDSDADGFADVACGGTDCNDADPSIRPGAVEICEDTIDQDCNGADLQCGCPDADSDGHPDVACGGTDCDDANAGVHPGAAEICDNTIDDDCDGLVDAADPGCQGCPDADGDGYESAACDGEDCDDADPAVNPEAVEVCDNGIDDDCDGDLDDADAECQPCPDADGDSYQADACGGTDCDDSDAAVHPGAAEVCDNGIDDDCDGDIDEADPDCGACPDADGDGYTDAACGGTDCNDSNASVHPAAAEDCTNGIDDNCDGDLDQADEQCGGNKASGCGCATQGSAPGAWLLLVVLGALLVARRRRR